MTFVSKELYATKDWRGKPAPSLGSAGLEWVSVAPTLPGKVLVVEFWATWCEKCHAKIPLLNEIHRALKDDVVVVGITDDDPEKVKKWLQTRDVEYFIASDVGGKFRTEVGISGMPNVLVIDSDGIVQWQGLPDPAHPEDPFTKEVVEKIVEISKQPKLPPAKVMVPVTEELICAGQLNYEQLQNLQLLGVKSVLNLRPVEEQGFIHEDKIVHSSIQYAHIPIKTPNEIDEANVATILSKIESLPKPCLIHCKAGMRAGAVALLKVASEEKSNAKQVSREQFLGWGTGLGFNFKDQPAFFQFLGRHLGE